MQFLYNAGLVEVLGNRLWDSSGFLPQDSLIGRLLHTLIGYTDRPTELQVIAYVATLVTMAALMRTTVSAVNGAVATGVPGAQTGAAGPNPASLAYGNPERRVIALWNAQPPALSGVN